MNVLLLSILFAAYPLASVLQTQSDATQRPSDAPSAKPSDAPSPKTADTPPSPKTTEVMVILTARQGVTRQQIMSVMPAEIRATVKLYLDGKIRQWYSKGDGKGVIFLMDAKTAEEAHAIVDTMPLSKENLVDHEYIPVGPLMPLGSLIGPGPGGENLPAHQVPTGSK
jgi:hypothetical protein